MTDDARDRAEKRFAAIQRAPDIKLSDKEQKAKSISDNTARLKALRLAKDAASKA
ncbi:hypothetical protein [Maritalea myrionectae]|uniref:hypothetical protein n=1 Tax=Maritalea myrionectae TaxID=454601 RepID=UPI0004215AD0|nr:hypothetical protein [Maritalea myrionectae]